ncbi:protein IQ-DOMAIN 1-like [Dorcoceras hygrometricum]|uniref:Protein IQ-DOMAIN 1-like n=1 Tax=Dorcoceras hygrometricum TaxID=472368 RepID=A0A2Z7CGE1_9LAMI|nr:protein IQ-DOMAIN 1-like [Dorcoceras hygrometricum]
MGFKTGNGKSVWSRIVVKKLFERSPSTHHQRESDYSIMVVHNNEGSFSNEINSSRYEETMDIEFLSRDDMAAVSIQTCFRGHLARKAFRALKSLVKLQALIRGVIVRRQSRIALQCMHALARLHLTIQARKLLLND